MVLHYFTDILNSIDIHYVTEPNIYEFTDIHGTMDTHNEYLQLYGCPFTDKPFL